MKPEHVIEAALLTAQRALPTRELRRLFSQRLSEVEVRSALGRLKRSWARRGLRLVETANGWRFRSKPMIRRALLRIQPRTPVRFSRAALETLAVIAYRQPVTRGDIEALRGVTLNPMVIRQFEERNWIEIIGYRETPGRPALWGTTKQFLEDFALTSLADLPQVESMQSEPFPLTSETPKSQERVLPTLTDLELPDEVSQNKRNES